MIRRFHGAYYITFSRKNLARSPAKIPRNASEAQQASEVYVFVKGPTQAILLELLTHSKQEKGPC
jgi:hypothetical protein